MTQPLTPASPTPHHGEPSSAHVTRHNPTVLTQCVAQHLRQLANTGIESILPEPCHGI